MGWGQGVGTGRVKVSLQEWLALSWDLKPETLSRWQSLGAPGWLSWLSVCLWLRSHSQGPVIESCILLLAQWSLFLSLPFPPQSQINKILKKKKKIRAAPVAQQISAACSPGRDPGDPGSSPTSGSLHGACFSLCLFLCLSLSLSL